MPLPDNPFQEVYFTDSIRPDEFTKYFSPLLISDTLPLFRKGNIVLKGTQGSGKSMLLALLKPEIRLAYLRSGNEFPVPREFSNFLSGGINLIRSAAIDFGQRIGRNNTISPDDVTRYFGDFINYWIVEDLLVSLNTLARFSDGSLAKDMGIRFNKRELTRFISDISARECWFGYLYGVTDYEELIGKIRGRILQYRRFLQGHGGPADDISQTTTSPGEPISEFARALWKNEILPNDMPVFVRIDQYESLVHLESAAREQDMRVGFRSVIHKMVGNRDHGVSYRLGGRRYAFSQSQELRMPGTVEPIEDFRNYKTVDIDEILRRPEHPRNWLFPRFVEDVCKKRLQHVGYSVDEVNGDLIAHVLGGVRYGSQEKTQRYIGQKPEDVIEVDNKWPREVINCLKDLSLRDVFSAKLGEAWVRQQIERKDSDLPSGQYYPWEENRKKWWKKERSFLVSMQIAARRRQKMLWGKKDDVINLSGGNVLVFLSIMQHVWGIWMRSLSHDTDWEDCAVPRIDDVYTQSIGIEEASDRWYDKISEEPPGGDTRRRVAAFFGLLFRNTLLTDKKMTYPGHNGISLARNDLEGDSDVYRILMDASAYGVMLEMKHSPKNRTRGESKKFYLHPILAAHFQIPAIHTKEPMYVDTKRVREWFIKAKVLFPDNINTISNNCGWEKES